MRRNDLILLHQIIAAVNEAVGFTRDYSRQELSTNRMLQLATVRLLEIIGEAAGGISRDCRTAYPEIAWQKMAGMKQRLARGYFDIDLDVLWQTVSSDLPPLLGKLERIISEEK